MVYYDKSWYMTTNIPITRYTIVYNKGKNILPSTFIPLFPILFFLFPQVPKHLQTCI